MIHDLDASRLPDQTQLGRPKARPNRLLQNQDEDDDPEAEGMQRAGWRRAGCVQSTC